MTNHLRAVEKGGQLPWKCSCFESRKREDENRGAKSLGDPAQKETGIWSVISFLPTKVLKIPF